MQYPEGSVIAIVKISYQSLDTYGTHNPGEEEMKSIRVFSSQWAYSACLSGQIEQEWKIISFG